MPELNNDPFSNSASLLAPGAVAPGPIQDQPSGYVAGVAGAFKSAFYGSPLASGLTHLIPGGPDNTLVSPEDAKAEFKAGGLDANVLSNTPMYRSTIDNIKEQQYIVNNAKDAAARSNSNVSQWVASQVGGVAGFAPLALIPGIGEGAPLATRVLTGAAEGGAAMGGATELQRVIGTAPGDRDISSGQIVNATGIGMAFGGIVKGALGARALDTGTVATLENSAGMAKKLNISVNDVVSPTGAVGLHQVEPAVAKSLMGPKFDVETLHNADVNKAVSQKLLDENAQMFPGDVEAQVIAYNHGPAGAMTWIRSGRNDAVLPLETQKYVAKWRALRDHNPVLQASDLPPEVKDNTFKTALIQASQDSTVSVDPVIQRGLAEHDAEITAQPAPKPLVVARKMPNGEVQYGKPGNIHLDLLSDQEHADIEGEGGLISSGGPGIDLLYPKHGEMGFAEPGGPFMDRNQAAAFRGVSDRPGGLESMYNEAIQAEPKPAPPSLTEAIPAPGSLNINERLSADMLDRINAAVEAEKPAETEELTGMKAQVADATDYAAHAHIMAFGMPKEGVNTGLKTALAEYDESADHVDKMAKGVEAAVRCGAVKGFS